MSQITIEAGVLAKAMKHAAAVVETRNTIPVLSNVRLIASGETLEVTSSDLDVEFRQVLQLSTVGSLATTVAAGRFASLAAAVEEGAQIGLKIEGEQLTVSSGRSRWRMPVLPADDFPMLEFAEEAPSFTVPAEALATTIGRVEWAVSTEVTKHYLHGPLLHPVEGKAALAGSDGNVLVLVPLGVAYPADAPEVILGPKFIRALQRLASEVGGDVEIAWDDRKVRARVGTATLTGKVIDGTFPDYRRIIPPPLEQPLVLQPEQLRAALRRVSLMADGKTRAVTFEREDGKVTVGAQTFEGGSGTEEIPVEGPGAERTSFNGQYLDRLVEAIGGDTIIFHQAAPRAGVRIERTVSDGAVALLMPMIG